MKIITNMFIAEGEDAAPCLEALAEAMANSDSGTVESYPFYSATFETI